VSFWSGNKLVSELSANKLIVPFDSAGIDCAAYTLKLGAYTFTTGDGDDRKAALEGGRTPGVTNLQPQETMSIQPGQFAFLLTEEIVTVPNNAIAFISVKAGRKLEGMVNVSGFHVDPGWSSRLIFGVLNAGAKPLVLQRGQPLFLIFYADLEPGDDEHVYKAKGRYNDIPPALIQSMSGPVPSLYKVDKVTSELKSKVDLLAAELKAKGDSLGADIQSKSFIANGTAGLALLISLAVFGKVLFFQSPAVSVDSAHHAIPFESPNTRKKSDETPPTLQPEASDKAKSQPDSNKKAPVAEPPTAIPETAH
jgi:dCTP deaminase